MIFKKISSYGTNEIEHVIEKKKRIIELKRKGYILPDIKFINFFIKNFSNYPSKIDFNIDYIDDIEVWFRYNDINNLKLLFKTDQEVYKYGIFSDFESTYFFGKQNSYDCHTIYLRREIDFIIKEFINNGESNKLRTIEI